MKKLHVAAFVIIAMAGSGPTHAQVYGQFTGAETVPVGGHLFGAYAFSSENVVGLLSQLRLSFYPHVDFGFQGGIARQDYKGGNRTTIRLGTDLKVKVLDASAQLPVTVAIGGDLGVESGDDFNVLTLGPTVVAGRYFTLGQNSGVTPYARVGLAITNIDVGPLKETDISVPLRLGGDFRVAPELRLALELQLHLGDVFNDNVGLAAGVNLPF